MSDDLDPKGLEAAYAEAVANGWAPHDETAKERAATIETLANIVSEYLAAIEPEGEPDRIAVVVNDERLGAGLPLAHRFGLHDDQWEAIERVAGSFGHSPPFARAIVECRLPRPAEPAVVKGRVTNV